MMRVAYTCLVLVMYICLARGADPITSITCDEKGTLSFVLASPWTAPATATCAGQHNITTQTDTTSFVIKGCNTGTNVTFTLTKHHTGIDGSVTVIAEDETMDVTFRCDSIKADKHEDAHLDGLIFTATHSVKPIHKNATEMFDMVMELRITTGTPTSTTTMDLNEHYHLLIAGAGSHDTSVIQCTAAGSVNASGIEIYPTSSPKVLTDFTNANLSSLKIKEKNVNQMSTLTGFRLVGSDTLYLKCSIKVCVNTGCVKTTPTSPTRKRKGGKHPTQLHYATLKLDVRDNLMDSPANGAADTIPSGGKMMKFIVMVAIMNFLY